MKTNTEPQAENSAKGIRILCVDDHGMVIEGVRRFFETNKRGRVVAHSTSAEEVLPLLETVAIDVCILDMCLQGKQSLWLLGPLGKRTPPIPVVIFTMVTRKNLLRKVLAMGATSLAHKADGGEELLQAVESVIEGKFFASQTIQSLLEVGESCPGEGIDGALRLSPRELEIFELIGSGRGNREIAELLGISIKTVETHKENLKRKLDVETSRELAQEAHRWAAE
jgi:two-component system nitrate/nitrite response regulator NarL